MSIATKKMAKRYTKEKREKAEKDSDDDEVDLSVWRRINATAKLLDGKLDELKAKVKREVDRDDHPNGDQAQAAETTAVVDPASKNSDSSDEEGDGAHAFDHPSTDVDQAWIWLPKDPLGLSEFLMDELKAVALDANMDEQGVVEVTRNPRTRNGLVVTMHN
ncbi:hypothetical protein BDZ97DRAFT_1912502 [Flammula alnicola]|nr:hypothetical protein BDZ97DRAFT_1912502 [Flammula alnicola]